MSTELATIEIPEELMPVTKQSGIEKADFYALKFAPFMATVKELSAKTSTINHSEPSPVDAKLAREVRLALVKNRTATAKEKDESKAALLAEGNLIQSLHNVIVSASQLVEADLTAVEKYAENKEKERIEAIRAHRSEELSAYVLDTSIFPLGTMTDDAFAELLTGSRLAHEARIEAERKAEEQRIAEENAMLEEQKRIREENERLKAEQAAAEAALAAERAEQAKRLAAIEEENRKAREKAAKEQAERERKAEEELKAKQAEVDRLAKIEADRVAAEKAEAARLAKIEADRIAAEKKAAKAPIKEKIKTAINALELVLPDSEISADILAKFNGFKTWAVSQADSL